MINFFGRFTALETFSCVLPSSEIYVKYDPNDFVLLCH